MQHRTIYFISTEDIIFVFQFMYGIQLLKKIGHHLKVLSINISVTSEHKHARFKVEDSIKIPFPTSLTFNFFFILLVLRQQLSKRRIHHFWLQDQLDIVFFFPDTVLVLCLCLCISQRIPRITFEVIEEISSMAFLFIDTKDSSLIFSLVTFMVMVQQFLSMLNLTSFCVMLSYILHVFKKKIVKNKL